jgi:hypothetical protein
MELETGIPYPQNPYAEPVSASHVISLRPIVIIILYLSVYRSELPLCMYVFLISRMRGVCSSMSSLLISPP